MFVDTVASRWMTARLFGEDVVRVTIDNGRSIVGTIENIGRLSLTILYADKHGFEVVPYRDITGFRKERV